MATYGAQHLSPANTPDYDYYDWHVVMTLLLQLGPDVFNAALLSSSNI